jgi:hypothetical protein
MAKPSLLSGTQDKALVLTHRRGRACFAYYALSGERVEALLLSAELLLEKRCRRAGLPQLRWLAREGGTRASAILDAAGFFG